MRHIRTIFEEITMKDEKNYIELELEDGSIEKCEVVDIFDFENKTYALLLPAAYEIDEDTEIVIMEYIENGDEAYFQDIESDDEYNRVCDYVEQLNSEDEE